MEFLHESVMLDQSIEALSINPAGIYVDGTAGGGGHSLAIAQRLTSGRLISIDKDAAAVAAATKRLESFGHATVVKSDYADVDKVLDNLGIEYVDGILLDLGVSSFQLDNEDRGFSYHADAPLDMRMDTAQGITAAELLKDIGEAELAAILFKYADEKYARRIARAIVNARQNTLVDTTAKLSEIIKEAVPAAYRRQRHPARRTFQAIRIVVNAEMDHLQTGLNKAFERLNKNGRLVIITFHSLEDRIVKRYFAALSQTCVCPKSSPICTCGGVAKGELVYRKALAPTSEEIENNPRSRSAKLRAIKKL